MADRLAPAAPPEPVPPRSRVRDRNSRRILEAVRTHIEANGFDSVSMRQLAQVSDVSVRTLYNLFGDRTGLIRALVHDTLSDVDLAVEELQADDPIERAWEVVDAAMTTVVATFPRAVLVSVLSDHELVVQLASGWRVRDLVIAEVADAQRAGELYGDLGAEVVADQVGMAFFFLLGQWAAGAVDDHELVAGALRATDLCLLAVAPPHRRPQLLDHLTSLATSTRPPVVHA